MTRIPQTTETLLVTAGLSMALAFIGLAFAAPGTEIKSAAAEPRTA